MSDNCYTIETFKVQSPVKWRCRITDPNGRVFQPSQLDPLGNGYDLYHTRGEARRAAKRAIKNHLKKVKFDRARKSTRYCP